MSEYIEIEVEATDDPQRMQLWTNVSLTGEAQGQEVYDSQADMEEGSPLAQMLATIEGIRRLRIEGQSMIIERDEDVAWHVIIADISAAVRDFFL